MTIRLGLTDDHIEILEDGEIVEFVVPGLETAGRNSRILIESADLDRVGKYTNDMALYEVTARRRSDGDDVVDEDDEDVKRVPIEATVVGNQTQIDPFEIDAVDATDKVLEMIRSDLTKWTNFVEADDGDVIGHVSIDPETSEILTWDVKPEYRTVGYQP